MASHTVPQNLPYSSQPTAPTKRSNYKPAITSFPQQERTFQSILDELLPISHLPWPPAHAMNPSLTAIISELNLHPTLEASLHLLNEDLPSAHFLVRHMNGPPAIEGMLLHSILHAIEGDFNNARAWLSDVRDAVGGWVPKRKGEERLNTDVAGALRGGEGLEKGLLDFVYGEDGEQGAEKSIDDMEHFRSRKKSGNGGEQLDSEAQSKQNIRKELERVVEWCRRKFGEEKWIDASEAWVRSDKEVRKIGKDMVSGGKGWREF